MRTLSLFENNRKSFRQAIDEALASLRHYGAQYDYWCVAYSGGKDSSATVSLVVWAIKNGLVPAPKKLHVLYADTRQELPPLQRIASRLLADLNTNESFVEAQAVLPEMDKRFYVYMLGRGVPPPSNTFRWCTESLKIKPMESALQATYEAAGQKLLQITGVRLGESAARDERIAISCNSKSGECGQGWFQTRPSGHVADTLAPLLTWRQCFVWDWLYFAHADYYMERVLKFDKPGHGYDYLSDIAVAYGDDDARTGCIGCNLASKDVALENLVKEPIYTRLSPLMEIKSIFAELKRPKNRLRKAEPGITKAGNYAKNAQRLGPLTMQAREWGLGRILDIQQRAGVDLINVDEESRIHELWQEGVWPHGWAGDEVTGDVPLDSIVTVGNELVVQPRLV